MSSWDRREDEVRELLDAQPQPVVPWDLAARAAVRGQRAMRRRRAVHLAVWAVLLAALITFTVWAALTEPWAASPRTTTPPLEGW
ncbi:hypothetical protein [Streptomyces zagrosensis]|uniref:Ferric-dicitrate binding protein FerR (Iron transport regulator) n=1 Tax=Streptomyces zagrosensis TaxID=1042984 RepID=A0A7W9QDK1_9ACTN|nr:hypothetical protein [Streptomyces zagrosensis]MBB5938255.1 ferric-dicitrate binding protein FerR (iron transport regulator) [Streptomyces zagrosensis]